MNRKAVFLLSSLRTLVRGVAISALRRASALNEYKIAESCVLTFDYCEDYSYIVNHLRGVGYLEGCEFFNIFNYFASREVFPGEIRGESSIARLLRQGNYAEKRRCANWCEKYSFPDGRNVFEFYRPNSDAVYLRAVTLGENFLWDYTPEVELVDGNSLIRRFHGSREFWAHFIEEVSVEAEHVHVFQDASYIEKGDTRDKFCAIKKGKRFYNYRVAHGATQVNIRKKDSAAIPSWGNVDEHWKDFTALVFLTNNQREHWIASQGQDSRLVVVPHESGIDDVGYTERSSDTCVYITSLTPLKHVDMAIRAFARVVESVPSARFEIYGQGGEHQKLEELIKTLSLESSVFLMGYSINAQKALRGAAVSILTSERESFGMPILESYAFSCPVVSFDVNYGPHELVEDGVTGYKVPFGAVDDLAAGIIRILDKSDTSTRLRRNCYMKSKDFSRERISEIWGGLIEEAERDRYGGSLKSERF